MEKSVIKILGWADGSASPFDGQWLAEYDPRRPGRTPDGKRLTAHIVCTSDPARAMMFDNNFAAAACWRQESGRPYPQDKPLTAFTVDIGPLETGQ